MVSLSSSSFVSGDGSVSGLQNLLRRFHPRHVGVVEDGEPVRLERKGLFERLAERLRRLVRQAVDQINVHRVKPVSAHPLDHLPGHLEGLDAVHRLLHRGRCPAPPSRRG